jgi:hypothetical protein
VVLPEPDVPRDGLASFGSWNETHQGTRYVVEVEMKWPRPRRS